VRPSLHLTRLLQSVDNKCYSYRMEQNIRLNKYLSQCGIASRRKADELIASGQVLVNGRVVTELGLVIDPARSVVKVGGKRASHAKANKYYAFHKPKGYLCSKGDPYGRPTIYDILPEDMKNLKYAGRLDADTEGLLILTDDGDLIERLTHPRNKIVRTYRAMVWGHVRESGIESLRHGVEYEGERYQPAAAAVLKKETRPDRTLLQISITEGRKREVKMMCRGIGHPVESLKRISFGPVNLSGLAPGRVRPLTAAELGKIRTGRDR
jgi:23S rRNA pseudouridine2605 synthase